MHDAVSSWPWSLAVSLAGGPAGWAAGRLAAAYAPEPNSRFAGAMIVATMAAFGWAGAVVPAGGVLALSLILAWVLVTLAAIDLISLRLPDVLTLPLIAAGLAASAVLPGAPIIDHLIGSAAGYGVFAALALAWRRWRRKEGIGLGDAKLLAAAGAWLGWRSLPSVVVMACAIAFVWVGMLAVRRGRKALHAPVAFGAPLCVGTWIVWLHGPLSF
ncbi:MAG TPA: A24 family peptidase [Caulobacteraceae bacterium]|nr:A24 family peptidase [Caulobacteraceae bacterium]